MSSESVRVVVRCRPLNDREKAESPEAVLSVEPQLCQCSIRRPGGQGDPPKQFTFDGAYSGEHSTERLYNDTVCPLVEVSSEAAGWIPAGSVTSRCGIDSLVHRGSPKDITAPSLPTGKQEVANPSPCRGCRNRKPSGGSSRGPLSTSSRPFRYWGGGGVGIIALISNGVI